MKTIAATHLVPQRLLSGIIALFCLAAAPLSSAATPEGKAVVKLAGEKIGHRKTINADSGNKRIEASEIYNYEFIGRVRAEKGTPAATFVKGGTDIALFLESISPGSSKWLKGSFSNPSGTLPVTILDRTIRGQRKTKGLGQINFSMKLLGTIDANGRCRLDVTGMKFKSSKVPKLGYIEYMKGSKVVITAAPTFTFIRVATTLEETAGSVTVHVRRRGNLDGAVSVDYTTVEDSATSADFTPTSGTLTFASGEYQKTITVPLIDNSLNDGVRRFTVELGNPSSGTFLGGMPTTKVVILDDE